MKTFKEFTFILERYYSPNEKLPSGKTPVEKAEEKQRTRQAETLRQRGRKRRHQFMLSKVRRGADNPNIDTSKHPELEIDSNSRSRQDYDFYHKPTGIRYNVYHSGKTKDGSPRYTISWNHSHQNPPMMSKRTRTITTKNALKVGREHILNRLPYGSVLHNQPTPNPKRVKGELKQKNTRSLLYKRLGFGPASEYEVYGPSSNQYARVGRIPSYLQAKKGKTRLKPLNPEDV